MIDRQRVTTPTGTLNQPRARSIDAHFGGEALRDIVNSLHDRKTAISPATRWAAMPEMLTAVDGLHRSR
ncbi:MAG: hypothetical protein U5O39_05120 [Gammaproteobacteria bacterium]|nr:hypothetical protein [Gammaproteobacteria bacterium]